MAAPANPHDDPVDAAALARYGDDLLAALDEAVPKWIARLVVARWAAWHGGDLPEPLRRATEEAGEAARADVVTRLRALLATDVDEQRTNPLALLRHAVGHATAVLASAGVPPVERDAQAERLFPGDVYDLSPAAFADIAESVHEPGLRWGAAKAHVVLHRRRRRS